MKKLNLRYLSAFLLLLPLCLSANKWNTPDMGVFDVQEKILKVTNHTETKAMAAVCYNNEVWYFTNIQTGNKGSISLTKLGSSSNGKQDAMWASVTDSIILKDLGNFDWQPAAVVFNNVLYLFVGDILHGINYTSYDEVNKTWRTLKKLPFDYSNASPNKLGFGMAATVVDGTLHLVTQNYWGHINFYTTSDLTNWNYYDDQNNIGVTTMEGKADSKYGAISAISEIALKGTGLELRYAYIDKNKHPRSVVPSLEGNGVIYDIQNQVISSERKYQSVAIVEGTVFNDPDSEGHCIQAFLKLDNKDNGYCRYRIQRFQSKEGGSWTKRENNLVKQNYQWARQLTNLCAVNYAVADTNNNLIQQWMCLLYTVYHDGPYYLTCAFDQSNYLQLAHNGLTEQLLTGPQNTQYIGYIEGVPPYYLNNYSPDANNYLNDELQPISELEFETSQSTSNDSQMGFSVKGKANVNAGFVKAGLSGAFGQIHKSTVDSKIQQNVIMKAGETDPYGKYIIVQPKISRAFYNIYDVQENLIDSTYYYFMSNPYMDLVDDTIGHGLDCSDPRTYMNRQINFSAFSPFSPGYTTWEPGSILSPKIEHSTISSIETNATLDLSAELGEMFSIGFDGSLDYSMTTTTVVDNSVTVNTRLKSPEDSTDIARLEFTTYWLQGSTQYPMDNWWVPDDAQQDQPPWCITYDVTKIILHNGTIILPDPENMPESEETVSEETESNVEPESEEQLVPTKFSLAQNYPNPFKPNTVIKYQIGIEDPQTDMENQGYQTKLAVYNLSGHQVALIVDEYKTAGSYEVNFDASQLTPGVYFYSLQSGSFSDIKKLILMK